MNVKAGVFRFHGLVNLFFKKHNRLPCPIFNLKQYHFLNLKKRKLCKLLGLLQKKLSSLSKRIKKASSKKNIK